MDGLKKRLSLLDDALKYAREYLDNLAPILKKLNEDDYNKQIKVLKTISDCKPQPDNIKPKDNLDRVKIIADLFHKMDIINAEVNELTRIVHVEEYIDHALLNRSRTWGNQLQDKRDVMLRRLGEMHAMERDNDNKLAEELYDIIQDDISNSNTNSEMLSIIVNAKSSNFIVYLSRFILDDLELEDRLRILERTEHKKDEVLRDAATPSSNKKGMLFDGFALPQRLISSRKLYPVTESMSVGQIMTLLNSKQKYNKSKSDVENLLSMSSDIIGVIVLDKSGYNPIEYNTRALIDLKYIIDNKLDTTIEAGINDKTIKRFQTISKIGDTVKLPKIGGEIHSAVTGTPPHIYVIETINKKDYRIISGDFSNFKIPYEIASKLLNNISSRPMLYHQLMESVIIPKLDPTEQRVEAFPDRVKIFTTFEGIKKQIIDRLISKFNEHIIAAEINSPETTFDAFRKQKELIIRTTNYIIGREMDLDKLSDEFRASVAIAFDEVAFEIEKKYQYILDHFSISPMVFKEYKSPELMKYVTAMYRDLIVKMYQELDEYPSKFEMFESPLKIFVFNKKVFMH